MISKNWRNRVAYALINHKVRSKKRQSEYHNFQTAKKIGIIWAADGTCSTEQIINLRKELEDKGITVSVLAFCPLKETAELFIKNFEFFTPKETGFFRLPKLEAIRSFLNEKYDILLDLSIIEQLPVQYIVALSNASMKVGWSRSKYNYYDLIIDISKQPECSFLIRHIKLYLDTINKEN